MTNSPCYDVGFSVGKTAASVLEIKEFVPGRPWGSQHPSTDVVASVPVATSTGGNSQGMGIRRSSLADMEKLVSTSSSRLSTSEWSLDGSAGESAANGGSKGIADPAGSLPALWTPLETSAGTPVPSSKGRSTALFTYAALKWIFIGRNAHYFNWLLNFKSKQVRKF